MKMEITGNEIINPIGGIKIDTVFHIIPTPFVEIIKAKKAKLRINDARLIFKKCRKVEVIGDRNLIDWRP